MYKLYKKSKQKLLKKLEAWSDRELANEYPFIWRRRFISQISFHLDLLVLSIITILCAVTFNNLKADEYYSEGSLMLISVIPLFILSFFSSNVGYSSKLPAWGNFDIKEEFVVAVLNILAKSFIIIYPFLIFNSLNSVTKPSYLKSIQEESTEYICLFSHDSNSVTTNDKQSDLKVMYDFFTHELNLNEIDKKMILKESTQYQLQPYDSLRQSNRIHEFIDTLNQNSIDTITLSHFQSPERMARFFSNKLHYNKNTEHDNINLYTSFIFGMYFLFCLVSYLEMEYFSIFMDKYIVPGEKALKFLVIPLILFLPTLVSSSAVLIELEAAPLITEVVDNINNGYILPALRLLWMPFAAILSFMMTFIKPLFIFLSITAIFLKRHLVHLSLKPK